MSHEKIGSADQPEYLNDRDAAEDRAEGQVKEGSKTVPDAIENQDRERKKERVINSVISKTFQH